jgi:hypothetical protein
VLLPGEVLTQHFSDCRIVPVDVGPPHSWSGDPLELGGIEDDGLLSELRRLEVLDVPTPVGNHILGEFGCPALADECDQLLLPLCIVLKLDALCAVTTWAFCDAGVIRARWTRTEEKDGTFFWVPGCDLLNDLVEVVLHEVAPVVYLMGLRCQVDAVLVNFPGQVPQEVALGVVQHHVEGQLGASNTVEDAQEDDWCASLWCGSVRRIHSPLLAGYPA